MASDALGIKNVIIAPTAAAIPATTTACAMSIHLEMDKRIRRDVIKEDFTPNRTVQDGM